MGPIDTGADTSAYALGATEIFTLFFVMLGPFKLLGPFAKASGALDAHELRKLSLRVFLLAMVSAVAGGFIGVKLIGKWHVEPGILSLTAGVVFFAVAMRMVMAQYAPSPTQKKAPTPREQPNLMKLVFPNVLAPHGIAAVVLLLATSRAAERTLVVLLALAAVMILNLLAMLAVRPIMRTLGQGPLQVAGAVLGVLQIALALGIVFNALTSLGVVGA